MSTTIDERVVEMRFDNQQFENNVSTTMSTLDKLKQSLNLTGASKGLENVSSAAKSCDMSGLGSAVETVRAKFSALQVMGVTALANITNSAVNAGKRIVSALTIDPIKTGFSEYETQINAVQTILANTSSKGTTLQDVNSALDTLNAYADKTIYNFTEMTKNIGTFTAAGIDLDTSVSAIQGIANLAAVSGSTSQQASTAMYQLSQALSSGTVKLQDWNSVVNAGMGGQVFQDALKRTATIMGTDVEAMIEEAGSFRESLSKGWVTSDVLTTTLEQFTMAAEEGTEQWEAYKKSLTEKGYTDEQATEILKMANTATDAATKVKTFTQLWDTLKEAAQSGWTQSWEIIVGDFEEAKSFLTDISNTLGDMINASSEARNEVLVGAFSSGWKQWLGEGIMDETGYVESVKAVATEHGVAIDQMIKDEGSFEAALKKGLSDGTLTSDMLSESVTHLADKIRNMSEEEREAAGYTYDHLASLEKLEKGLKDGTISVDEYAKKITELSGREVLIKSIENAFTGVMNVVKPIKEAFTDIFPPITSEQLRGIIDNIQELTEKFATLTEKNAPKIKSIFTGVFSVFDMGKKVITSVADALLKLAGSDGISDLATSLLDSAVSIADFFTSLNKDFDTDGLSGVLSGISSGVSTVIGGAVDGLQSFGDILSKIGDAIVKVAQKIWNAIKSVFTWITDNISIGDVFAGLAGGGIFMVAKKISGFIDTIKDLFGGDGKDSPIASIKENFSDVLDSVKGSLDSFTSGIRVASLVSIAAAIGILSVSMKTISELDVGNVVKSLTAIGIMMKLLMTTLSSMTKSLSAFKSGGLISAGVSLILVAEAINILADAMIEISKLSLAEIGKGLLGIGVGLLELCVALKIIDKVKISLSTSIAILALAKSCEMLADALKIFSTMSWSEIGRGLTAMGGALAEFVAVIAILNKAGGFKSVLGSAALLIAVQSLDDLAAGLKEFGSMSWDAIGRGLAAMGGALSELAIVVGTLGKLTGFSSILGAGAILIVVQGLKDLAESFKEFGSMSWDAIGRGLVGMGGALIELGVVSGALGYLTNFAGILGAATIWVAVQGLGELADAFKKMGSMSWSEIGRGLAAMGGALLEIGVVSGALGYLTNMAGMLGAATIWMAVQGLDDLANALQKFGSMSWDAIGRGLAAMGGALGELALGGILNSFSVLGYMNIAKIAEPLGILADSVKKWENVTVPDGLGWKLTILANGIASFTFSGLSASALAKTAPALGVMADSVKKWEDVIVPNELPKQISSLSDALSGFWYRGISAAILSTVAPSIGVMADSIKKWEDVTVPEDLGDSMKSIAEGISAFTFAFAGGWSLNAVTGPLGELADDIKKWDKVSIPEDIGTDLGDLADGVQAFSFAFLGGWTISDLIEPLGDLADVIEKWNDVSVPEDMEDGLASLAEGVKAFNFAFMGGWSIDKAVEPIGELAIAIEKWADVTVPESLGDNLSTLAEGVKAFTFGGSGAGSIAEAAPALGVMADSVKKWEKVTVPDEIASNLDKLAEGVKTFASSGSGAESIANAASGVGTMADSVKKWSNVTVDENLGENLKTLASGVKSFTFGGSGAESLTEAAPGVGTMADSVKKWANVTLPENLGENLKTLASGVKSFTFGGAGAESLTEAAPGVGTMADSVKKWNGVTVPENMGSNLQSLASGVKTFASSGSGAESLVEAASGVGTMADSVKKWSSVTVPESLGENLKTLASGVKSFTFGGSGAGSLTEASSGVGIMADSIKKWTGVTIPENLVDNLGALASGVKSFTFGGSGADSLATCAPAIGELADSVKKWSGVTIPDGLFKNIENMASSLDKLSGTKFKTISSGLDSVTDALKDISKISTSTIKESLNGLGDLGESGVKKLISAFENGDSKASSAAKDLVDGMSKAIKAKLDDFETQGEKMATKISEGIKSKESSVKTAGTNAAKKAVTAAEGQSSNMKQAGYDLGDGLVEGIEAKWDDAYSAGYTLGQQAVQGEKDGQASASPSKLTIKAGKWLGEGLVIGMEKMASKVYDAGYDLGGTASGTISSAISSIVDMIDNDIDAQPTIRPVLDLSDVESGAGAINGMLSMQPSIGLLSNVRSINTMMNRRNQNGTNEEVVSAIKDLKKTIGDTSGNTYTIGGISYSEGSEVSNAIEALVRAVTIERRA